MFLRGFLAGLACASASWYTSTLFVKNDAIYPIHIEYQENRDIPNTKKDLLRFGIPYKAPAVNYYTNHALSYNWEKRIPHWVLELLDKKHFEGSANRKKSKFQEDPFVLQLFAAKNDDYFKSGWSRGHMAAAGNHKFDQKAMDDTFYLSNIVPQDIDNNSGFWNRFEMYCRDLTKKFDKVWVVSGPLFLSTQEGNKSFVKYEVIGNSEVAVPTHLYKVIVTEKNKDINLSAFVVPNKPISKDKKLLEYKVPLENVESKSGLIFFPQLQRVQVTDLCNVDDCKLIEWQKFELDFIVRNIESANNLSQLQKAFDEIKIKKLNPDNQILEIFSRKKQELTASENLPKEASRSRG